MVKKSAKRKEKEVEVDEERSLAQIENPNFVKMWAMQKAWSAPTTHQTELELLVSQGFLRWQKFFRYVLPCEHLVPSPSVMETVLFIHFVHAGLCFPPSVFFL